MIRFDLIFIDYICERRRWWCVPYIFAVRICANSPRRRWWCVPCIFAVRICANSPLCAEIAARGPIACGIDAGPLETWVERAPLRAAPALKCCAQIKPHRSNQFRARRYTGGILNDKTGAKSIDHIISIVGYGVEDGVKVPARGHSM